jgi:hypothetical protein
MPTKHLSDILFDYLFESSYNASSDEEAGGASKTKPEGSKLKNKDILYETKKD